MKPSETIIPLLFLSWYGGRLCTSQTLRVLASLEDTPSHIFNNHKDLQTIENTTTPTHNETHPISSKFVETLKQLSSLLNSLAIEI